MEKKGDSYELNSITCSEEGVTNPGYIHRLELKRVDGIEIIYTEEGRTDFGKIPDIDIEQANCEANEERVKRGLLVQRILIIALFVIVAGTVLYLVYYGIATKLSRIQNSDKLKVSMNGSIRLRNGETFADGLLEYYLNGNWLAICHDLWDMKNSEVACRQLNFSIGNIVGMRPYNFTTEFENVTIGFNLVQCKGDELTLSECVMYKIIPQFRSECDPLEGVHLDCNHKYVESDLSAGFSTLSITTYKPTTRSIAFVNISANATADL